MQEITGEHSKDITAVLQALVRDGLLTQQNQRRWASYRAAGETPPNRTVMLPIRRGTPPKAPPQFDRLAGLSDEFVPFCQWLNPLGKTKNCQ